MLINGVFQRIFRIEAARHPDGTVHRGTAFFFEHQDKQYVCTARHVLCADAVDVPNSITVDVHTSWASGALNLRRVGERADLLVLAADLAYGSRGLLKAELGMAGAMIGENVYALGYPFGRNTRANVNGQQWSLPFVKRGVLSAIQDLDGQFYVDMSANRGMSGGPVLYGQNALRPTRYQIYGMISGFIKDEFEVLDPTGSLIGTCATNSNLAICYPLSLAKQVAEDNPIGPSSANFVYATPQA